MDQARERRIEIIRRRLLRSGLPRFQVALILFLTGLAGFLTSFFLLHLGVTSMWLRYPMVVLIAYGIFLLLLALWLWLQRRGLDADYDPSVLDFIPSGSLSPGEPVQFGGGGDFGGGGAGGSWGECVSSSSTVSSGSSASSGISFDFDLEEGWLIVLAIVALVGGLIASLYVIYIAPALLAEILVDGALVAGLYKRVKHVEQRHWLRAAIRQTLIPALLAALFVTVAGYALQRAVPEAHSMGEVWKHLVGR
jgi:hypothetical protein